MVITKSCKILKILANLKNLSNYGLFKLKLINIKPEWTVMVNKLVTVNIANLPALIAHHFNKICIAWIAEIKSLKNWYFH